MKTLKLVAGNRYACRQFPGNMVERGGEVEVTDDVAEKLLASSYLDKAGNEVKYFQDVTKAVSEEKAEAGIDVDAKEEATPTKKPVTSRVRTPAK